MWLRYFYCNTLSLKLSCSSQVKLQTTNIWNFFSDSQCSQVSQSKDINHTQWKSSSITSNFWTVLSNIQRVNLEKQKGTYNLFSWINLVEVRAAHVFVLDVSMFMMHLQNILEILRNLPHKDIVIKSSSDI